jgi:hypothetical protein
MFGRFCRFRLIKQSKHFGDQTVKPIRVRTKSRSRLRLDEDKIKVIAQRCEIKWTTFLIVNGLHFRSRELRLKGLRSATWGELSGNDTSKMQVDEFGTLKGCTRYWNRLLLVSATGTVIRSNNEIGNQVLPKAKNIHRATTLGRVRKMQSRAGSCFGTSLPFIE